MKRLLIVIVAAFFALNTAAIAQNDRVNKDQSPTATVRGPDAWEKLSTDFA